MDGLQHRRHLLYLAAGQRGPYVAVEVDHAAPPVPVLVGDEPLLPLQATLLQAAQELRPALLVFLLAFAHRQNLPVWSIMKRFCLYLFSKGRRQRLGKGSLAEGSLYMPIPGSNDDGTMIADLAYFELPREIIESEQCKPWPSGIHARTLYKKHDFRVVLISMEAAAQMKEHHIDGTSSVQMLKGHIRYSTQGQVYDLRAGDLLTLGASIRHEVEAMEESVFLLTISWPANQELLAMLHRGYGT
jgi:quercetin dioxygenase-like cupin family protein